MKTLVGDDRTEISDKGTKSVTSYALNLSLNIQLMMMFTSNLGYCKS